MPESRIELREACARAINSLTKEQLLQEFAISRVAYISGLDVTQIPVYTTTRALSASVAIHAGKALSRDMARAGAILEGIEVEVAEHPSGQFRMASALQIPEEDRLPLEDCFPTRSSVVNDMTLIPWEEATNIQTGAPQWIPSDLIWMIPRLKEQPLLYFQMGSNGLASGATLEDAILSGLYEIIERDAWTLHQYLLDNCGLIPARTPLVSLPPSLETIVRRLEEFQIKLHLFDCTNDYKVPVFGATLLDTSGQCAGTFAGYGAHINAETAALRAVLEAAQGRVCYISGARDDLLRRQFLLMKRLDQIKLNSMLSDLPTGSALAEYRKVEFPDVKSELRYVLKLVRGFGVSEVYVKDLGAFLDGAVHVVRVFSPQCEPYRFDFWAPTLRCLSYAERRFNEMKEREGEQWKA